MGKPFKGMYKDCNLVDQPEGTYRDAQNMLYNKLKDSISNEEGFDSVYSSWTNVSDIYGFIELENSVLIFFKTGDHVYLSEFDGITLSPPKLDDPSNFLNLSTNYPIKGVCVKNNKGERIIVWVDGLNSPKILNIDTPETGITLAESELKLLELFPITTSIGIDNSKITVLDNGGSLLSGSYAFAIRYLLKDGGATNYFNITGFIPIIKSNTVIYTQYEGNDSNTRTTKSIRIDVTGVLDTSYEKIELAVIKYISGNITAAKIGEYYTTLNTIIYSSEDTEEDLLLEEVISDTATYNNAKTITYANNSLFLGNLTKTTFPDYREFANDITINWTYSNDNTVSILFVENSYRLANTINTLTGFMPDEVYAFYISFILKDGSYSPAFHIPGREAQQITYDGETFYENDKVSTINLGYLQTYDLTIDPDIRYFHTRNTGNSDGTMGYWENQDELYETDYPDLAGEKIRHHKFPSLSSLLEWNNNYFDPITNPDHNIYSPTGYTVPVLGINISGVRIPASIEDLVIGYEIFYAKRTFGNSTVIAQGIPFAYRGTFANELFNSQISTACLHPADLLKNDEFPSISPSYLKNDLYIYRIADGTSSVWSPRKFQNQQYCLTEDSKKIIKIDNYEYVPYSTEYKKETCLKLDLTQLMSPAVAWDNYYYAYLSNICTLQLNAYNDFKSQQLLTTGKVFNINELGTSVDLFGGDTYINEYGLRLLPEYWTVGDTWEENATRKKYGSFSHLVYNRSNVSLRISGDEYGEKIYPGDKDFITLPVIGDVFADLWGATTDLENNNPDLFDNYIEINNDFIVKQPINSCYPWTNNNDIEDFPTLIINSNKFNSEDASSLRTFLALNNYEMPRNKGEITNLESIGKVLLIHHEDGIYRTVSEVRLDPSQTNVILGSGKIFDIEPEEVVNSKNGYAGLSSFTNALMTKAGYVFVDTKRKKIFLLSNNIEEISVLGLKNWFYDNIEENDSFAIGFDDKYNRILITNITQEWTVSFNIETKTWTSFHTYTPEQYFTINTGLYSLYDKVLYLHNSTADIGEYYPQVDNVASIDFVVNNDRNYNKLLQSIELSTIPIDETFTSIEVLNSKQHSGTLPIVTDGTTKNTQYLRGKWNFNSFHDLVDTTNITDTLQYEDNTYTLNEDKEWYDKKRFIDKYNVIRLINDNSNQTMLYLSDINVRQRISQF